MCSYFLGIALVLGTGVIGQTWTTANSGNWSNPATWISNTVPPSGSTMGTVTILHSVTLDQNAIAGTLNINAGVLTASGANSLTVTGTATIASGAVFTNSSSNASKISISSLVVSNGGTYNHDAVGSSSTGASSDFPGVTRTFGASSNVVITKWANGGTAPVPLPTINSPGWGNFTINLPALNGDWKQKGGFTKVQGDLSIINTNNKEFSLFDKQSGGATFSGNVTISGGKLCILINGSFTGNGVTITINGNLNITTGGILNLTTNNNATFGLGYSEPRIHLKGNLLIDNTGKILQPKIGGVVGTFLFRKTSGTQFFTCSNLSGISEAFVGWGVGDETLNGTGGSCNNILILNSHFIAGNLTVFRVFKNATLYCPNELYVKGAGASIVTDGGPIGFALYAGGNLKIGSKDGVSSAGVYTGNIQTSGARNFNAAANYIYTGIYNQVTGNGLPTTITGSLSVNNTGASNDNIVTLTTNNTETKTLNLNSGYFAAGTGQTLKISNNGTVNGIAGGDCIHLTANGGNIYLLGNNTVTGSTTGYPNFYDVTIGSGISNSPVTFSKNGTNYHYCTINNEGSVNPKAPTYATGSTLIYNSANSAMSPYNRSIEWGQATAGAPGYPWHVVVQNATNLNLGTTSPPLLECGGNLTIGVLGSGAGTVNMNSLAQPLIVKGHLTIGDTLTGSPAGTLNLSNAIGGDLYLYGNFSRGKNSIYTDNSRAIYFKGTTDATINTPAIAITPGVPSQYFSYARIDKTNGTEIISLNCPVGINNEISFIKGVVTSTATNLLSVTNSSTGSIIGGSDLSFVNGPLTRAVNSINEYDFPVGKTGAPNSWRPVSVQPASSTASVFWAEYFIGPTPNNSVLLSSITSLENNEYWNVNRTSGSTGAVVKLNYEYPGSGSANWVPVNPCADCNVAVAQYQVSGSGYWDLTTNISNLGTMLPKSRVKGSNGPLYSAQLSNFSLSQPLTAAAYYFVVLPVNLLSFTGQLLGADGKLEWNLADFKDLESFDLEYSRDGHMYDKLATLPSNGTNNYHYLHVSVPAGMNYYRLLVKDKSGKVFYSKVVLLNAGDSKTILVKFSPTVVNGPLSPVIFSAKNQEVQVVIVDVIGRRIISEKSMLQTGTNQLHIPTHLITTGMYFMKLFTADGMKETRKFIKE
jgi:hypothetical protein